MIIKIVFMVFVLPLLNGMVVAHCPLCTAGVGIGAALASWLGVDVMILGLFVGGFSVLMGFMMDKLLRKKFGYKFEYQKQFLGVFSFLLTVLPIMNAFTESISLPVYLFGNYGSTFYRTYIINGFLLGGIVGGLIVFLTPLLSRKLSSIREDTFPFQTMLLTFLSLVITGIIFQLFLV